MEADWNEATRITIPGPTPNAPPSTLTTFAFDPLEELLWTGNEHVSRLKNFNLSIRNLNLLHFSYFFVAACRS